MNRESKCHHKRYYAAKLFLFEFKIEFRVASHAGFKTTSLNKKCIMCILYYDIIEQSSWFCL